MACLSVACLCAAWSAAHARQRADDAVLQPRARVVHADADRSTQCSRACSSLRPCSALRPPPPFDQTFGSQDSWPTTRRRCSPTKKLRCKRSHQQPLQQTRAPTRTSRKPIAEHNKFALIGKCRPTPRTWKIINPSSTASTFRITTSNGPSSLWDS